MTDDLSFDRYQRWRLILGKRVEDSLEGARRRSGAGAPGEALLSREMGEMDAALGAIYDVEDSRPEEKGRRGAGLGAGKGKLAAWLGDVRKYFDRDVVVLIQQDAIEKKGFKELLF